MDNTQRIIATAGIVSVGVGSLNSVAKNKRPPSSRFLIGSGIVYLALSMFANVSGEVAKGLAIGIMTTVLLGDGGGVLSYLDGTGETDTRKPTKAKTPTPTYSDRVRAPGSNVAGPAKPLALTQPYRPDTVPAYPGIRPNSLGARTS